MSPRKRRAPVELGEPLPPCPGPKLPPFEHRKANVRFIELLGDSDSDSELDPDLDQLHDGYVFEVEIASKRYALKIFRFYDPSEHDHEFDGPELKIATDKIVEYHTDPFYAECRAFGQIALRRQNGKIAVDCYGFMGIPASYENKLYHEFGDLEWNRPAREYKLPVDDRQPFRAVVKELVLKDTKFSANNVRKMARDLKKMRSIGVYPMDVRSRNYKDARFVDFSVSYTEPHVVFQVRAARIVEAKKSRDLVMFDEMMMDAGTLKWAKLLPNEKYCRKLRNRDGDRVP